MRRRSRKRKLFTNILACLMLMTMILSALPLTGLTFVRADTYISDRTGSIRAILMSQPDNRGKQTPYTGVNMKLYQVGTVSESSGDASFTLDSGFDRSGLRMTELTTADQWASAARTLSGMVTSSDVRNMEGTSDAQGEISYNDLSQGVYLLVQNSTQDQITVAPSLFTVPMQEDGTWNYDVKIYPKFQSVHHGEPNKTIQTINTINSTGIQNNTISRTVSTASVKNVKTGDSTQILMWMVISGIALAGMITVYIIRKKNITKKNK